MAPNSSPSSKRIWKPTQMPSSQAPARERRAQRLLDPAAHRLAGGREGADAWEEQAAGGRDPLRIGGDPGPPPTRSTARDEVAEVADAGVDDRVSLMRRGSPWCSAHRLAPGAPGHRLAKRQRRGLEGGLGGVMAVAGGEDVEMEGQPSAVGERLEEVGDQGERKLGRHPAGGDLGRRRVVEGAAAGEVDHRPRQRLVERRVGVGEADDPPPVPQRRGQRFAEGDPHVLDRMVEVDVGVPLGREVDPEAGVGGESRQHVAEETVGDLDAPRAAVEMEGEADAGLAGGPLDSPLLLSFLFSPSPGEGGGRGRERGPEGEGPSAARTARSEAPVPTDTRKHPASPG